MTSPQIETAKTKDEVYSLLANHMADCWWMFGEGKLNYVKDQLTGNLYCSICSQVAFDNSIDFFPNNEIDQKDFYTYLANTNLSGKDTSYLEYLTGVKNLNSAQIKMNGTGIPVNFGKISLNKQQYIVMGIINQVGVITWVGAGVAVGAGIAIAILTGGASIPATVAILGGSAIGGTAGYFAGTTIKGESNQDFLTPTIVEANSDKFNALKCESIKTLG
jgi:hypothetical protein